MTHLAPATGARAETPAYAGARTSRVPDRATCKGTRVDGEPCCSVVVGPDGFCRLHSPTLAVDRVENARAAGRRSGEVRRERGKSVHELVRERLELEADTILRDIRTAIDRGSWDEAVTVLGRAFGRTKDQTAEAEARREHLASMADRAYSDEPDAAWNDWRLV